MNYKLKKIICAMVASIITAVTFAACADDKNEKEDEKLLDSESGESSSKVKVLDLDFLRENMLAADESLPAMSLASGDDENAAELFAYLADYDYENVNDYFFSYAAGGTAEEIAVIQLADADNAKDCAEAVKQHVEDRTILFETYDPTQVERCKDAVVFYNDVYVVLIICDNDAAVKEAFYNAFED